METITVYQSWLHNLREESTDADTKKSIQRLMSLTDLLAAKHIFSKDATLLLHKLEVLRGTIEGEPRRTKYHVDRCFADMMTISAKFFNLVKKNHYQNEWTAYGTSLGLLIGTVVFSFTSDVAYLALGLALGIPVGAGIGSSMDKKAADEGRLLEIQ